VEYSIGNWFLEHNFKIIEVLRDTLSWAGGAVSVEVIKNDAF
jgi:hypothetical protein